MMIIRWLYDDGNVDDDNDDDDNYDDEDNTKGDDDDVSVFVCFRSETHTRYT